MIKIYIKPADLRKLDAALKRVEDRAKFHMTKSGGDMCLAGAREYSDKLLLNISKTPRPYKSSRYLAWKKKYGKYTTQSWRLFGDLVTSIKRWQDSGGWRAGIMAGAMDRGGKSWFGKGDRGPPKSIAMYAKTLEFGLAGQAEVPVFRDTVKQFKAHEWPELGRKVLDDVKNQWR